MSSNVFEKLTFYKTIQTYCWNNFIPKALKVSKKKEGFFEVQLRLACTFVKVNDAFLPYCRFVRQVCFKPNQILTWIMDFYSRRMSYEYVCSNKNIKFVIHRQTRISHIALPKHQKTNRTERFWVINRENKNNTSSKNWSNKRIGISWEKQL